MAAVKRSKRASSASARQGKKRKVLGDRTNVENNVPLTQDDSNLEKTRVKTAARANVKKLNASTNRKSVFVDKGDEEVYIQEKKDRSGLLHPATYDAETDKYYYTPKGATKRVAFDGRRHKLIKRNQDAATTKSSIQRNLLNAFSETGSEEDSDSVGCSDNETLPNKCRPSGTGTVKRINLSDSDSDSSEDEKSVSAVDERRVSRSRANSVASRPKGKGSSKKIELSDSEDSSNSEDKAEDYDSVASVETRSRSTSRPGSADSRPKGKGVVKKPELSDSDDESLASGRDEEVTKPFKAKEETTNPASADGDESFSEEGTVVTGRTKIAAKKNNYKEVKSESDESSVSSCAKTRRGKQTKGSKPHAVKRNVRRLPTRRVNRKKSLDDSEVDSGHESDTQSDNHEGGTFTASQAVPNKLKHSFELGNNDWRSVSVIDY